MVGIVLTLRAERVSESRANRLHRGDRLEEAAALYLDRVLDDTTSERLHYNLGTTLLRQGSADAAAELVAATGSNSERLRVRAHYNLGLWSLIRALFAENADSALFHARNAVEANKAALRLDPDHADAGWNLIMAQQVIVARSPDFDPGNVDEPNGRRLLGEIQIVEGPSPFGQDEGIGDSPSEAEEEALADSDLEPISVAEASEILGTGHRDPSTMTGKLLLREGRARRRRGVSVSGPGW